MQMSIPGTWYQVYGCLTSSDPQSIIALQYQKPISWGNTNADDNSNDTNKNDGNDDSNNGGNKNTNNDNGNGSGNCKTIAM